MERQKRKFCGADSHNGSGSGHLLHVNEHEDEHEDAQSSGEDDDALDRNEYIPSNSESSSADCDDSSDEDFCEKKESAASSLSVKRQKREMENINGDDSESSTNSESETMPSLVAKSKKSVHLKSKSAIAKIVKNCSEKEAKQLLVNLASVSKKAKAMIADFRPEKMPMGVPPLDHWALHCLFCESERNLVPLQDIKVCTTCDKSINDPSGELNPTLSAAGVGSRRAYR